ncbi:MAG TPA: 2-dehydropantoate 2-reductase [Verrucomicrobiae bacterium]|jgi:2-dehydropantoate 2-reductase
MAAISGARARAMKIAIVGCGALGSFYGAKLSRAGHEVHFLLRTDYEQVSRRGVQIESPAGSFRAEALCAREPEEIGPAELAVIALKNTANHALPKLLPPLLGADTVVLTLQNGLGNEAAVASVAGAGNTMGGVCFVCLNRVAPGKIVHMAHGAVVLGEYVCPPRERTHRIAQAFSSAGVTCKVAENLQQARWEKLVWNIPFNGLGVASAAGLDAVLQGRATPGGPRQGCLTTDLLLSHPAWENLVRELMMETIAAARALGLDVPESAASRQIERTRAMGAYKASTLIDYENGRELELDGLFLEPLRQARQAGVPCPRLGALCGVLEQLSKEIPGGR